MVEQDLISESEAAVVSGLTVFQLRKRRQNKQPPSYHKIKERVFYERSVVEHFTKNEVKSIATIWDRALPDRNKIKRLSCW